MKKEKLVLTCSCGCGNGIEVKYQFGQIYINLLQGFFYGNQLNPLSNAKKKIRLLSGNRCISDMLITEQELKRLIRFLSIHECTDEEPVIPAYFTVEEEMLDERMFDIIWYTRQSPKDILLGREYRCGEVILNEEYRKKVLKTLKNALNEKHS